MSENSLKLAETTPIDFYLSSTFDVLYVLSSSVATFVEGSFVGLILQIRSFIGVVEGPDPEYKCRKLTLLCLSRHILT